MDDDSFPADSSLKKWCALVKEEAEQVHHPGNSAEMYKSQFEAAGFTNVVEVQYKWPSNRWPKDKNAKELGVYLYLLFMKPSFHSSRS